MIKLERITLGTIDKLTGEEKGKKIGKGCFEEVWWRKLRLKLPYEKRVIKKGKQRTFLNGIAYLIVIDNYLKDNKMYLTEAKYFSRESNNKLKGIFYKEKVSQEE